MLAELSKRTVLNLMLAATIVSSCCFVTIPEFHDKELHRSGNQMLIVTNLTDEAIYAVPESSERISMEIPSRGRWKTQFIVVTFNSLDEKGELINGSEYNIVKSVGSTQYFTRMGVDWALTAGPSDDPWQHELSFGACWVAKPAEAGSHVLEVVGPPSEGLPVNLCP